MSALAIDPGKTAGLAIYTSPTTPIVASWTDPPSVEVLDFLRYLWGEGISTMVIEDQHLPRPRIVAGKISWKLNWPSMQRLILSANRWITCAEIVGMRVVLVKPAEWQGPTITKAEGKTTKQKCSAVVAATWPRGLPRWSPGKSLPSDAVRVPTTKLNEHIRDAAMMARWWMLYGRDR